MDKIDVVIVGAGLSGLACANKLAEKDMQVIVVERGDFPGSKNVTGGRLYTMPIREMVGDMFEGAPFESFHPTVLFDIILPFRLIGFRKKAKRSFLIAFDRGFSG